MIEIIHEDNEFQIVSLENGIDGDRFVLYENGIDKKTDSQRILGILTVDRDFLPCIKNVKEILLNGFFSSRKSIRKRKSKGDLIFVNLKTNKG